MRPSTGLLNRYTQDLVLAVADRRRPGAPSTVRWQPGSRAFAARASNMSEESYARVESYGKPTPGIYAALLADATPCETFTWPVIGE